MEVPEDERAEQARARRLCDAGQMMTSKVRSAIEQARRAVARVKEIEREKVTWWVAARALLHVFACFDAFESHGRNLEPGVRISESVTCEIGLVGEYVLLIVRWPSCAPEKCRGP